MTDRIDPSRPIIGPHGQAEPIPFDTSDPKSAETLCWWLITSPGWHPLWSQFSLWVARLRDDVPGFPAPYRQFLGATHELIVVAVNPENGFYSADGISESKRLPHLTPVNICQQHEATDAEMVEVAALVCRAIVYGRLNPEIADAPGRIRENWLIAVTKTLAHIRGEEHAP